MIKRICSAKWICFLEIFRKRSLSIVVFLAHCVYYYKKIYFNFDFKLEFLNKKLIENFNNKFHIINSIKQHY